MTLAEVHMEIAAIPALSIIQRAIAGQTNLTTEVFVQASEAISTLILAYASDPTALVEREAVDNETFAVRSTLKAQVANIGRALSITAPVGAPATCLTTRAIAVCAEKRVAADTGGADAQPYTLANIDDPSAAPTVARMVTSAADIPGVNASLPVEQHAESAISVVSQLAAPPSLGSEHRLWPALQAMGSPLSHSARSQRLSRRRQLCTFNP